MIEICPICNLEIIVGKIGGHRIFDANGVSHYITKGWKSKNGQAHFVK